MSLFPISCLNFCEEYVFLRFNFFYQYTHSYRNKTLCWFATNYRIHSFATSIWGFHCVRYCKNTVFPLKNKIDLTQRYLYYHPKYPCQFFDGPLCILYANHILFLDVYFFKEYNCFCLKYFTKLVKAIIFTERCK